MDTLEKSATPLSNLNIADNLTNAISQSVTGMVDLRTMYESRPVTMHTTYPAKELMSWPRVIYNAYASIWSGAHTRVIIKAPRGGGKSKLLGTIGFDFWYLKQRKVVNMGGSAVQAKIVYEYFRDYCDIAPSVTESIEGVAKAIETEGKAGQYFSSVTASTKQVRGKHPDVLISDETCETSDELIHAALPMVDSSQNPLVIMASTFHKIYGIFQETWDGAIERGYLRIQWDIFDVCKTFDPNIWEREDIKKIIGIEKLKAHAKGRTGDPQGYVKFENILQAWREKPTEDWFEVEYMGSRPSAAGLVLKPEDVDRAMYDAEADHRYDYVQGATVAIGIDWGFSSMTAVTEVMLHLNEVVVLLDNRNYHQTASEDIIADIVKRVKSKGIRFIYADSAGKFENVALQNALAKENIGCAVIEVVFSKEKFGTPGADGAIGMIGNLRAHFEQGKIKIPKKFAPDEDGNIRASVEANWQLKRYRYQEGTDKPIKKDDHVPDSLMCALQHFMLGRFARAIPTQEPEQKEKKSEEKDIDGEPGRRDWKPVTRGLRKKIF